MLANDVSIEKIYYTEFFPSAGAPHTLEPAHAVVIGADVGADITHVWSEW